MRVQDKGPRVLRAIGDAIAYNFDADLVGDGYLFSRLRGLAAPNVTHPLVTLSVHTGSLSANTSNPANAGNLSGGAGDPSDFGNARACQATLTKTGEQVLAGHANAIELNGIDDWILGVHLDSKHGRVWRRKEGAAHGSSSSIELYTHPPK